MPRCVHSGGCDRLVAFGMDLCTEHYGDAEPSPCCRAQVMAARFDGDPDTLFGVCSRCDQVVIADGVQVPVGVEI